MITKLSRTQRWLFRASQIARVGATLFQTLADVLWKEPLKDEPRLSDPHDEFAAILMAQALCAGDGAHWLDVDDELRQGYLERCRQAVANRLPTAAEYIAAARKHKAQ